MKILDVIIIGAGASGLFCAALIAKSGKSVLVLESGKKVGRKILMSGGGFCNFTNLDVNPSHYLSQNPHFVKSALARYTQWDFITLVSSYNIAYYEKELGQLFTQQGAEQIVSMLLTECEKNGVVIQLRSTIQQLSKQTDYFTLTNNNGEKYHARHVVIATGGLSMPKLGVTPFGYQIAEQFGLKVVSPRASLVPFTWREQDKWLAELAGISLPVKVTATCGQSFYNQLLFTHRGISGPAILQISNYWQSGESIEIDLLPQLELKTYLQQLRQSTAKIQLKTALNRQLPKKWVELFFTHSDFANWGQLTLAQLSHAQLNKLEQYIHHWQFIPNGTEGYRTAEVTLGGVDTHTISSKTMEANQVKGLYFIGEVLDVTGWLGGYNFQWAWSSAYACAEAINNH
ncbi:aminoacetone oxidase family FAD-binding enzyme [Mergibacter septicus]|uniref:Aminoacetone oxidase family FAD-binding enzyme n=1 Tax=Mergibacter septicus TaxID=221402 RepID=A0A8D4J0Q1_9PAST|nr:NAD(P)/FAD-dependent oxidoreductase [Mergibacter septicus]AWX15859.1 aminoacetone oxidase family FAD-binding enzyme [Mergibacter septicus]QDJ15112.1 aminoacetone oxidase family FAD-binding enzyme [Mergibacter septicus]UTU47464.1 NAD(P)/FAD-dependent oxidoreductase [Mergibacter septicus]WMR95355.1 NAD(P)/FAD-dependent oxidoreductase [Mergibacter septicus]